MRISRAAAHRPVFTVMVTLIVIIIGGVALSRLPVDLMPDITYPSISVSTDYENASPEEIEQLVTRPIEQAMSAVPGVEEVTSSSYEGSSSVSISFAWGTDLDAASNDVRDRLDRVIGRLPDDASRPRLRKFDLAAMPILMLGASSRLDQVELRRIIDEQVSYRIERVPGVAAVDVWGGLDREVQVALDPEKVKALGVPLNTIIDRVSAGNVNVPAGSIERGNYEVTIRTPGEYTNIDELRNTVVAVREGVPIRLAEVARVQDTWQRIQHYVRVNGEPGIRLAVSKQSGMNTVEVATGVRREVEQINNDLPQIHLTTVNDSSEYIQRSMKNVSDTALYGGILAVLVLLFFLRNVRATLIVATAIPTSIMATFALLYFCHYTLNLMTLGGLAVGVGMLVDDAIVVIENIHRLREAGEDAASAAVNGTEEVTAAVMASTLTTMAVFLPMVFVRGMSGVMFKQMAVVVAFSLGCSLVSALTLVPMLALRLERGAAAAAAGGREKLGHRVFRLTEGIFTGMQNTYTRMLDWSLNHRAIVVLGSAGLLAGSLALIPFIGVELMPQTDEGEVRVDAEMEVGTRLDVMEERFHTVEAIVKQTVPEATRTIASVGGNSGNLRLTLVAQAERRRSSMQIADDLRPLLSNIPGVIVRTRASNSNPMSRVMGGGSERVRLEIRGYDLLVADALAQRVKSIALKTPGVTDVRLSRESGRPEELVRVDRVRAADLKVTVSDVAHMLETVLAGTTASNFRVGGDEYPIVVKLESPEHMELNDILDLTLSNADGEPVVLRNLVSVGSRRAPTQIDRKDQERIVSVAANISGRDMGSIIADIRESLRAVPVPQGFSIIFSGDFEEQQKAFRELLLSIILALVLVYMVMACQYESLRDPFVVMFSVPLAAIGVVLILLLTNTTFNVQTYIGCIMLGGIVVKNAILLVDHTNVLRRRDGMALRPAMVEAGRRRLRPILMTALTTSLGLLPLAIGWGEGGEAQAPMARAVIGGLFSSTLITLVFVPIAYSIFERGLGHLTPAADEPANL